jgi:DNA-binding transcriptional ArsR family regulator
LRQLALARQLGAGHVELRARGRHLRAAGGSALLGGLRVDAQQHLAGTHGVPGVHVQLQHAAGHLRRDHRLPQGLDLAVVAARLRRGGGLHGQHRQLGRRRRPARHAGAQRQGGGQRAAGSPGGAARTNGRKGLALADHCVIICAIMQIRNRAIAKTPRPSVRLPGDPPRPDCPPMSQLTDLPPAALEHVAHYFRTLSEPTRLRILNALGTEQLSVGEIAEQVESSVANVSRHLAQMAQQGLVAREQQGNSVLYRIDDPSVHQLCDLVCGSIVRRLDATALARAAFTAPARKAAASRKK